MKLAHDGDTETWEAMFVKPRVPGLGLIDMLYMLQYQPIPTRKVAKKRSILIWLPLSAACDAIFLMMGTVKGLL